jgi:hypothetical protein
MENIPPSPVGSALFSSSDFLFSKPSTIFRVGQQAAQVVDH